MLVQVKFAALVVTLLGLQTMAHAQPRQGRDTLLLRAAAERVELNHDLLNAQLEPSYITVGGAPFNIRELGNAPYSLFEGMIVPHLSLYRPDSGRFALFVTPKVIVRQLLVTSLPVRTPSFMPRVTAFFALQPPRVTADIEAQRTEVRSRAQFLAVTISHHSNGQEDSTYRDSAGTRVLNLRSGEFNTNYAEVSFNGAYEIRPSPSSGSPGYTFVSLGVRAYHKGTTTPDIREKYGMWRGIVRVSGVSGDGKDKRFPFKFEVNAQALLGGRLSPRDKPFLGSIDLAFRPRPFDDFWTFGGVYWGQDYYNLSGLGRRLATFRIGMMATPETGLRNP